MLLGIEKINPFPAHIHSFTSSSQVLYKITYLVNILLDNAVTQTQLDNFQYFAQYATAAYCANNDASAPGPISCINDVCPVLTSAKAVTVLGFDEYAHSLSSISSMLTSFQRLVQLC